MYFHQVGHILHHPGNLIFKIEGLTLPYELYKYPKYLLSIFFNYLFSKIKETKGFEIKKKLFKLKNRDIFFYK